MWSMIGKTTLLNYLLRVYHGKRIVIIENEFSSGLGTVWVDIDCHWTSTVFWLRLTFIGIEGLIARNGINGQNITNFIELNNGCICCSIKDDLLRTLEQLILHSERFDYIVIETTGIELMYPMKWSAHSFIIS